MKLCDKNVGWTKEPHDELAEYCVLSGDVPTIARGRSSTSGGSSHRWTRRLKGFSSPGRSALGSFVHPTVFGVLWLLAGCAQHTPNVSVLSSNPSEPAPSVVHKAQSVTSWEIKGLIGAKTPKKAWSANLVWTQQGPSHYQLRLFGPMGGGTVLVEGANGVVMYQDEHKRIQGKQARQLLREQTGVDLPVESLYYWVRGLPAPGKPDEAVYDANHQLLLLKQAGYLIDYSQYQVVNGYVLPAKMKIQGKGLVVKLVIKGWRL
ncbi:MAG: lipoprotein insertase outer membrane protein LolB [Gammaproteobacteria bacterium]|nr:lipoprotein insertase outer membrane protein LolB [Gammaproteobacteria bacterium]